jgi:hypothetical protein
MIDQEGRCPSLALRGPRLHLGTGDSPLANARLPLKPRFLRRFLTVKRAEIILYHVGIESSLIHVINPSPVDALKCIA